MIAKILFSICELILAIIIYRRVFHVSFTTGRLCLTLFSTVFIILSVFCAFLSGEHIYIVPGFIGTMGLFLIYRGEHRAKVFLYSPLIIMAISIISNSLITFATYVLRIPVLVLYDAPVTELIVDLILIAIFALILLLTRHSAHCDELILSNRQYLLFLFGEAALLLLCSFMQYVEQYGSDVMLTESLPLVSSLFSLLALLFICLCLWQQNMSQRTMQLEREKEEYTLFVKLQTDHYNEMIRKNDELRRFRHDYRSHMRVLNTYLQDGKIEDALTYLESISGSYESSESKVYTGILSLDSIIGDYENAAISGGISWSFDGRLPELPVKDCFALCTIFSNLLKNAIEACRKNDANPFVETSVSILGNYISIIIRNSCLPGSAISAADKDSPADHGWGLKNVRRTAMNSNGSFEISIEDSICTAEALYQHQ